MTAADSLARCLELAHRRLDLRDRGLPPHLPGDQVAGVAVHRGGVPARPLGTPLAHRRLQVVA